jgi:hypothetical protein
MSHPDPLFDPDNAYEDDDMAIEHDPSDILFAEYLYDGNDDVYEDDNDSYDDSMDGDMETGLASAGWGTDEDYGYYGDDTPMSDDYYGGE